jgi:hypothetical protein
MFIIVIIIITQVHIAPVARARFDFVFRDESRNLLRVNYTVRFGCNMSPSSEM